MDALMPDVAGRKIGNDSVINTDIILDDSVIVAQSGESGRSRRRRPLPEKAVRRTYSFYPRTVRGLERYADDNGMTYSHVVNLALRQLIPGSYFE
jgi:hypothetical protein